MKDHRLLLVIIVIASSVFIGCTNLTVTKVTPTDPNKPGVRYALPQVFLIATPASDGGLTVEPKYLPDADNTYAVDAWSLSASHTLDIAIQDGMLTKIQWKPNSATVVQQGVQSAGEITKSILETKQKAEDAATAAAKDAAKEKAKALQAKIDTAQSALNSAIADRDAAKAVVEYYADDTQGKTAKDEDKIAAGKALVIAEAKVKDANAVLETLLKQQSEAASQPSNARLADPKFDQVYGPVMYAVVESDNSLKLVPVLVQNNAQRQFPTTTRPKPPDESKAEISVKPDVFQMKEVYVIRNSKGALTQKDRDTVEFYTDAPPTNLASKSVADDLHNLTEVDTNNGVLRLPRAKVDNYGIKAIKIGKAQASVEKP